MCFDNGALIFPSLTSHSFGFKGLYQKSNHTVDSFEEAMLEYLIHYSYHFFGIGAVIAS